MRFVQALRCAQDLPITRCNPLRGLKAIPDAQPCVPTDCGPFHNASTSSATEWEQQATSDY